MTENKIHSILPGSGFHEIITTTVKINPSRYNLRRLRTVNHIKISIFKRGCELVAGIRVVSDKDSLYVLDVYVTQAHRKKGYATYLIAKACTMSRRKYGATIIELDDMSNHAWQDDNVYKKMGFKYMNPYPECEMRASVRTILSKCSK